MFGVSGGIELVLMLKVFEEGIVLLMINFIDLDFDCDLDYMLFELR